MRLDSVSVIIINLNGGETLLDCVGSIEDSRVKEIIVVDNGSSDGSADLCVQKFPNLILIQNSVNEGFAGPCNQGAENAQGDFLLFLNNDAKLGPDLVKCLVDKLSGDSVAATGPRIIDESGKLQSAGSFFTWTGFLNHVDELTLKTLAERPKRFALNGACLLVKKSCFFEVGGFDNQFFAYFEESDLCWRLINKGYDLIYVDEVFAVHQGGMTSRKELRSSFIDFLSFRNRIVSIRRNLPTLIKFLVIPAHLMCCVVFALAFLLSGKPKNSLAVLRAIFSGMITSNQGSLASGMLKIPSNLELILPLMSSPSLRKALTQLRRYLIRW